MALITGTPLSDRPRTLERGTAVLSGLIVAGLTGGVAVLSASVLSAVLVAFGITVALALALGFLI